MKNKKSDKYALLKRKIWRRFCLIAGLTIIAILLLSIFIRGTFGDISVVILRRLFNFSMDDAVFFYHQVIRNNLNIFIIIVIIISLVLMLQTLLTWVMHYFEEVHQGVNNLMNHKNIHFSSELAFMELELNKCKDSIEKREQEARVAEQKKNDLVVYLAHDIKTPLTSVIGYLELINEVPEMPIEQRAKYLHITLEKANRLEQLIDEFFDITRFNLNTIVLNQTAFNLSFMLQQIVDEFYPMLQTNHNYIDLQIDQDVIIYGDSDKLSRVFNNIIKNAIAYSYPSSAIIIQIQNHDQMIEVSFVNHGTTIPKHKLDTIFEKFYRLDSSRSSKTGGAGLGLAIAKEIVEAHNGSITVTSKEEYTTFIVCLPK